MKTASYPIAVACWLLTCSSPAPGADGDWPMWRHDPTLTAYQPTPGAMASEPRVLARHSLGVAPMAVHTAPSGIITGDADGDGRPEALLGGQDGRPLAVRDGGEVAWSKSFDGPMGTPLLADLDGDGKVEAIVGVGDGFVYVLGP